MQTIAFFGGSFNPPHVAHQMVCLYLLETQPIDRVFVVPTYRHPFDKPLASFADRLEMCRLAMEPLFPRVVVSDVEGGLGQGPSVTIRTLEALAARHPDARFRLVIGADLLSERGKWHRWADIERLAPPIVVGRQGHEGGTAVRLPAVSSTEIRERIARGEAIDELVPRRVVEYLRAKELYR